MIQILCKRLALTFRKYFNKDEQNNVFEDYDTNII